MWEYFFDEATKLAELDKDDYREGTALTHSFAEFKKHLQPGDIIVTKPNNSTSTNLGLAAKLISKAFGSNNRWVHSGIYSGGGKQTHTQYGFDHKKKKWDPRIKVRDQTVNVLKNQSDAIILRPRVSEEAKLQAIQNMKKLKGVGYSMTDLVRAAIMPSKEETDEAGVPQALMCNGSTGWSYRDSLKFRPGVSQRHLLPHHIVDSEKVDHVIAFSRDKNK